MSIHLAMSRGRPRPGTHTRLASRRRWFSILAALALPLAVLVAPTASAGTTPPFTIGPADAAVVPGSDGAIQLEDPEGNVKELGPLNSNTTKIGVIHSDVVPTLGLTNPNGQVDLRQAWLNTAKDADQDDWIYFAWERDNETGSGFIAFEFMKNAAPTACAFGPNQDTDALIANCNPWANRDGDTDGAGSDTGDFLILWDQQGGSKDLWLRTWNGTAPNLTLSAPILIPATYGKAEYSADGFFGEAAVNITQAIYGGVQQCIAFANVIPSTVTGNSDTADYKDTILRSGISLSNCQSSTVTTPKLADGSAIPAGGVIVGGQVKDSAVVTVTPSSVKPQGSVSFWICKLDSPELCDGTVGPADPDLIDNVGALVGTTNIPAGNTDNPVTVVSPAYTVSQTGRYCWRAVYSGSTTLGIPGSSDYSSTECFNVVAVASSMTTAQTWVPRDSATISAPAGGNLAGTVSFALYASNDCAVGGDAAIYTTTRPVAGASPQTVYTVDSATQPAAQSASGSFSWLVSYDSTNPAQLDISSRCHETSVLTITNGGTVSSP